MQVKRTRMYSTRPGWVSVMIGCIVMLGLSPAATSAAKERPRRLPKGVEVVRLPDGSHDVTVKMTSPLPTGDQVQRVPLGDRLEEVARILCPQGHEMIRRDGSGIRIVFGRVVATQAANVRCVDATDTATSPTMETP